MPSFWGSKGRNDMSNAKTLSGAEITAEKTTMLKGIALILLMWHHLFGCGYIESWLSPFDGVEFVTGMSALICLTIFLFCSGFGLYKSYISKENAKWSYIPQKIIRTLIPYWVVMLLTIIVLVILGKFEPKYILINLFAWFHDDRILYVSFSWYIKLYLLLLVITPLIRLIELKWKKKHWTVDILIYIVLPFAVYYIFKGYSDEYRVTGFITSAVSSILLVLYWLPLFSLGILFAKYNVYGKVSRFFDRFSKWLVIVIAFLICGNVLYMRFMFNFPSISDVLYGTLFIVSCLLISDRIKFKSKYVLPYLGKNSLFYWLLSGIFFFNTKELLPAITWPSIPVFMLIWVLLLLTPFVFACDWVSGKITGLIIRKKKD